MVALFIRFMENSSKIQRLRDSLQKLYYLQSGKLLFHGWHHITFVSKKAVEFAKSIHADVFLVESAGLVHDLNYVVRPRSEPEEGKELRQQHLREAGYTSEEILRIETIVMEEHLATRDAHISNEGKALSDADTLFKALPITIPIFASKYMQQTGTDIAQLAHKVTSEQNLLMEAGIYFYTDLAKQKYLHWAKANLALWNNVEEGLKDPDVVEVLTIAQQLKVI